MQKITEQMAITEQLAANERLISELIRVGRINEEQAAKYRSQGELAASHGLIFELRAEAPHVSTT